MSTKMRWPDLEEVTREAIERLPVREESPDQRQCGCMIVKGKGPTVWLCTYHEGYDDGVCDALTT